MCTGQGTLDAAGSDMARQRPLETPKTLEMMLSHLHQRMVNTQQWHWLKDHATTMPSGSLVASTTTCPVTHSLQVLIDLNCSAMACTHIIESVVTLH